MGIFSLMQAWSLAIGIYSYWHPTAILGILGSVVKKSSMSNVSSSSQLQALFKSVDPVSHFVPIWGRVGSKENF